MIPLCVVFDLDDTLYLERDYVRSGFRALDGWVKRNLGLDGFFQKAWKLFLQGERGHIFDQVLSESGIVPDNETVALMVKIYREHEPEIVLPSDATMCLESLLRECYIGLITDGPQTSQRNKIGALGLARFIQTMVLTSELGNNFSKPHSRAFLEVQRVFDGRVRGYVYVADNPKKDFLAPLSLGWTTVRVRREGGLYSSLESDGFVGTDVEVSDLRSLSKILFEVIS